MGGYAIKYSVPSNSSSTAATEVEGSDSGNHFYFVTIKGSGHMVPQFRPRASLHMIEKLVALAPLAPPLAGAAKLANMSEGEFDSYLDAWTVGAQAAPYVVEGRP